MDDISTFAQLGPDECWALLATEPVGRVGVSIEALPAVLPVNYAVLDGAIVFRTSTGSQLDEAAPGAVIAFEVDHYERETHEAWSVLVRGVAEEIVDPDELERVRALSLDSWALDGAADHYVRVPATLVTGRIIRRPSTG